MLIVSWTYRRRIETYDPPTRLPPLVAPPAFVLGNTHSFVKSLSTPLLAARPLCTSRTGTMIRSPLRSLRLNNRPWRVSRPSSHQVRLCCRGDEERMTSVWASGRSGFCLLCVSSLQGPEGSRTSTGDVFKAAPPCFYVTISVSAEGPVHTCWGGRTHQRLQLELKSFQTPQMINNKVKLSGFIKDLSRGLSYLWVLWRLKCWKIKIWKLW